MKEAGEGGEDGQAWRATVDARVRLFAALGALRQLEKARQLLRKAMATPIHSKPGNDMVNDDLDRAADMESKALADLDAIRKACGR